MVEEQLPILYSFRRCPYAIRSRMALYNGKIQYELREVVLKHKPQEMLAVSEKGTVPVLYLSDGTVVDESLNIMLWALRRCDTGKWLQPESGSLNAMLQLIHEYDDGFKYHLDRYKYPQRFGIHEEQGVSRRHFFHAQAFLAALNARLQHTEFLFGHRMALADAAVFPYIRQFSAVEPERFRALPYAHLQRWLQDILIQDCFIAVMQKYEPWKPNSLPVRIPIE